MDKTELHKLLIRAFVAGAKASKRYPNWDMVQYDADGMNESRDKFINETLNEVK